MLHQRITYRNRRGRKGWGLLFALVVAFAASGRDQSYVVKPQDTLSGLAQRNGLSVSRLASCNAISPTANLYVGQRLRIPGTTANDAKSVPSRLESALVKAINQAPVKGGRWQTIVVHHAAVDEGSVKSLDRYHREQRHMENGLAYHFLIGNGKGMGDGEIAVGNRWKKQLDGGHLHSEVQNQMALGICLIGDFSKHPPTARQLRSLEDLVRALMRRCQLDAEAVKTHQQVNVVHTQCPGSKFPTRAFLARLKTPAD
jgi:LysM repeat protein